MFNNKPTVLRDDTYNVRFWRRQPVPATIRERQYQY